IELTIQSSQPSTRKREAATTTITTAQIGNQAKMTTRKIIQKASTMTFPREFQFGNLRIKKQPHLSSLTPERALNWAPAMVRWGLAASVGIMYLAANIPMVQRDLLQADTGIGKFQLQIIPSKFFIKSGLVKIIQEISIDVTYIIAYTQCAGISPPYQPPIEHIANIRNKIERLKLVITSLPFCNPQDYLGARLGKH
ncbi:Cytochrome b-c1 complex subunit 10, partial [Neolecta irregularis DAH-3]